MYIRNLLLALIIIFSSISAKAQDASYVERLFMGREFIDPWRFHFRLAFGFPAGDSQFTSDGIPVTNPLEDKNAFENFYGAEVDFERFITDYFSLSVGLGYFGNQADTFVVTGTNETTDGKINLIPLEVSFNFRPAPFGQVDPYIGIGYAYNYLSSSYDKIDIDGGGGGLLLRLGLDYWFDKKTSFNFEAKKKFLNVDADFSELIPGNEIIKSEQKADPLVFGVGIGYKF